MSLVHYERRGPLATIRLNHPEEYNAPFGEMLLALSELLEEIRNTPEIRVVILTGEGPDAFCAGSDVSELTALNEDQAGRFPTHGQTVCNRIENYHVPVIAAVNGIAAGGGCELALACHIRIASPNSRFNLPQIKLGVIPAYGGTHRLTREIGPRRAPATMLMGGSISSEQALEVGLISRVVDQECLLAEAESLANEIANLAPLAIRACLEAVIKGADLPLDEGLALETQLFASLFATEDVREGTRAFLEKRKPVFKGT
jgi:enoyl-CoA hydratase